MKGGETLSRSDFASEAGNPFYGAASGLPRRFTPRNDEIKQSIITTPTLIVISCRKNVTVRNDSVRAQQKGIYTRHRNVKWHAPIVCGGNSLPQ